MNRDAALLACVMRLGDNALVLGQRLIELVAGEHELEEELANANFSLDYIGQARLYYSYAAELEGRGRSEDDYAFLRDDHEFCNFLLVEQPNGHFGDKIVRQVLFESWYSLLLDDLTKCTDARLAAIAARAAKEIRYHLRHGSQWLVRLGDGTAESHAKVGESLERLWRYCGELLDSDEVDDIVRDEFNGPDIAAIRDRWMQDITVLLGSATLAVPEQAFLKAEGRRGRHSEHFGYLLAEMQHLQRTHPGATW